MVIFLGLFFILSSEASNYLTKVSKQKKYLLDKVQMFGREGIIKTCALVAPPRGQTLKGGLPV